MKNTCRSCKYYDSEKLWCNKWNNEKYSYNQIQKGCFAFELKKRLSKESKEEERKKEERRIKRLKKKWVIKMIIKD